MIINTAKIKASYAQMKEQMCASSARYTQVTIANRCCFQACGKIMTKVQCEVTDCTNRMFGICQLDTALVNKKGKCADMNIEKKEIKS